MYINNRKILAKRINIFEENKHSDKDGDSEETPKLEQEIQCMIESKRQKTKNMEALLQELKREHDSIQQDNSQGSSNIHIIDGNASSESTFCQETLSFQSTVKTEKVVIIPTDEHILNHIHDIILNMIKNGIDDIKEFSKSAEALFPDTESLEYIYYMWRAYSLLQGDSLSEWSTEPCQIHKDYPLFIPPVLHFSEISDVAYCDELEHLSSDSEDELEIIINNEPRTHLTKNQRRKLDYALRNLTMVRNHIAYVMMYCIRHSEASEDIVDAITESILSPDADANKKIARLYLLSDVLYNSNSINVEQGSHLWKYRMLIENKLFSIVEHWIEVSSSLGKLKMEHMRRVMLIMLDVWLTWGVFPFTIIESLKKMVTGNVNDVEYDDIDGIPLED